MCTLDPQNRAFVQPKVCSQRAAAQLQEMRQGGESREGQSEEGTESLDKGPPSLEE